uniref:Uncharacterized protein n=1 Tax=Mola mola TaxID=94237 RepID=A0A3Q3XPW6_MOLML
MKHPSVFFVDEISADSSSEFPDRASMMEVRLQAQEDEITLLKSSLADALRRIRMEAVLQRNQALACPQSDPQTRISALALDTCPPSRRDRKKRCVFYHLSS